MISPVRAIWHDANFLAQPVDRRQVSRILANRPTRLNPPASNNQTPPQRSTLRDSNRVGRDHVIYRSGRFWILAALLLLLSLLGVIQYHWITQVSDAERGRAEKTLGAALNNLENDFDAEITRAFLVFQVPLGNGMDYADRYREWLRHAPYPELIRGVYVVETEGGEFHSNGVIPGEPEIASTEWKQDLRKLATPVGGPIVSGIGFDLAEVHSFSSGNLSFSVESNELVLTIDGNPAFVFPVISMPASFSARILSGSHGRTPQVRTEKIVRGEGPMGPTHWVLLIFNADYVSKVFLPRLAKLYFSAGSTSDYQLLVVNKNSTPPSPRVIFGSEAESTENQFTNPDGRIDLFELRLDCFLQKFSRKSFITVATSAEPRLLEVSDLSEILAQRPPSCGSPALALGNSAGKWEMLVRYRIGSLDQAMATFRHRNLLLGASVLLVLALGITILVILTERARALLQMRAEFALGISHELRTPLTVIRLAADNLRKGIVENAEQAHKYGAIIHGHASELSSMIEETLALARVEPGRLVRDRTIAAPEEIVAEVLRSSQTALHDAGMEVDLDIARDLPRVRVDVPLLKRCIENLIQNATKYAADGRWLGIRAMKIGRAAGERVRISVEDRGPGIAPNDVPHIFEPFYRGKRSDGSEIPGIGLGLALVKLVVEAHRGAVEVENRASGGTAFSILLPPEVQKNA